MNKTILLSGLAAAALAATDASAATKWTYKNPSTSANAGNLVSDDATPVTIKDVRVVDWTARTFRVYQQGNYDFAGDQSLVDVDLTLPVYAEDGTTAWTIVGFNEQAFASSTYLRSIKLPAVFTTLPKRMFNGCTGLETVELPLGMSGALCADIFAFNGCTKLSCVYVAGSTPVPGAVVLPDAITELPDRSFLNCKAITNFVGRGVTTVHYSCFGGDTALRSVEFSPDLAVLDIGSSTGGCFDGCSALVSFSPSKLKLTKLDARMFSGCSKFPGPLDLSESTITAIKMMTFNGCGAFADITLPTTIDTLNNRSLSNIAGGARIRFCGPPPTTMEGSSTQAPLCPPGTGVGQPYRLVVDAATYPAWTNGTVSGATFTALADSDTARADYPGQDTVGWLSYGSNGRKNWLVQYVDRSLKTVTWLDDDGETVLGTTQVENGGYAIWTNAAPTKASTAQYDYAFAGWTPATNATPVTAATSFTATYSATTRSYEIMWLMDDGSMIDTSTVPYGETPTHANPTKAGNWRFTGWTPALAAVTGAATYTAAFEEVSGTTWTITWLDDDGSQLGQDPVADGDTPVFTGTPAKAATAQYTYAFAGWTPAVVPATQDATYTATYTPTLRSYAVSFVDEDGSTVLGGGTYDYGTLAEDITLPSEPTKAATAQYTYAFSGWSPAVATVTGAVTHVATYAVTPVPYTLVYLTNGVAYATYSVGYGEALPAPADPTRTGYTFRMWSPALPSTMPAADFETEADWTAIKYTITWVNGDATTTASVAYDTVPTPPTGTKAKTDKYTFTFLEWTPEIVAVTGEATYSAAFRTNLVASMRLAYGGVSFADGTCRDATLAATLYGYDADAAAPGAEATATNAVATVTADAAVDGASVTAAFRKIVGQRGYDWTLVATQFLAGAGAVDTATLHGRFYAKPPRAWFGAADAVFDTNGVFAPATPSSESQQLRLRIRATYPDVLSDTLADGTGHRLGIEAYQPEAGVAPRYYCWNGAAWIKLVGEAPKPGETVELLGVVDFAARVPSVAWYADGFQLTTEDGAWEIPLAVATPRRLSSFDFENDGWAILESFAADVDIGANGTMILIK